MIDVNLLRSKMVLKDITYAELAKILGIHVSTLHRKIKAITEFSRKEIQIIKEVLDLSEEDVESIFFRQQLT